MENNKTISCNKCKQNIDFVNVHYFDFNGSDTHEKADIIISDEPFGCNYIQVGSNATLNDFLDDYDDFIQHIWCPLCDEFPFKEKTISTYQITHVVFESGEERVIE